MSEELNDFFAHFDLYNHMAYFVAKVLHIRPGEILDTWSAPELTVAYGHYANEISRKNYETWASYDSSIRGKIERPEKYNVKFYGVTSGD